MTTTMQTQLDALIAAIETSWRTSGYAEDRFPALAARALAEWPVFEGLTSVEILEAAALREGVECGHGPPTSEGIPLFEGPRFSIILRVAANELATPESHAWCGAYQVLAGLALHSTYAFTSELEVDASFALGQLERRRFELLLPRSIVEVALGGKLIHALTHLERPALALVVRTTESLGAVPARFLLPGVLVDPGSLAANTSRRVKCFDAIYAVDRELWLETLHASLGADDPRTCFDLLRYAIDRADAGLDMEALCATVAKTFGAHIATVRHALVRLRRDTQLAKRLRTTTDAQERFVLAALHVARDREDAHALVSVRYPTDATTLIARTESTLTT